MMGRPSAGNIREYEPPMHVVALYNNKGGVGKTAAAVNLAYLAARDGALTLLWDLDPQGAASFCLRVKARIKGGGKRLLRGDLDAHIKATDYANLELLPADFSYRNLDLLLEQAKKPERSLHKQLKPLAAGYDFVFLDCPPSISLVSESIFYASATMLVPVIPTPLSLRTLAQLSEFRVKHKYKDLTIRPFFSMVDRRRRLHRELLEQARQQWPQFLTTPVPYASEVERMASERRPLAELAPRGRATLAYAELWRELALAH